MAKNIILLSLSPINYTISNYAYEGGPSFECWYQLEPGSRQIAYDLQIEGQEIAEIIMLCTSVINESKEGTFKKEEKDICTKKCSAKELFISRLKDSIKPVNLTDEEFFHPIIVDENNPSDGLVKLTSYIREKYGNVAEDTNIYMVTNGGLRGIQRMLEAVLTLLKLEGFKICESYGTDTNAHKIIKETDRLKIFDFVAGMKEFLETGKNNSLQEYLGSDDKLSAAIGKVADGIQWSNINALETGLQELVPLLDINRDNIVSNDNDKLDERQTYLKIFKENIRRDYGSLIGPHDIVDEIIWCMNKNFYQQALTLLEAKMSEDYFKWGIFSIVQQPNDKGEYYYYDKKVKKNEHINGMINSRDKKFFLNFEDSLESNLNYNELRIKEENYFDKIEEISYKFECNHGTNDNVNIIKPFLYGGFLNKNNDIAWKVYVLLALHKILKRVRNDMNHLNDSFPNPQKVASELKCYLKLANEIRNDIVKFGEFEMIPFSLNMPVKRKKVINEMSQKADKWKDIEIASLCNTEGVDIKKISQFAKMLKHYFIINGLNQEAWQPLVINLNDMYGKDNVPNKSDIISKQYRSMGICQALEKCFPTEFEFIGTGNDTVVSLKTCRI